MIIASLAFAIAGTIVIFAGLTTIGSDIIAGVILFCVGALFAFAGFYLLAKTIKQRKVRQDIIKNGRKIYGTIVDYSDNTSMYINNIPLAYIVVKYTPYDVEMTGHFKTDSTNTSKYPIGSTVCIYEWHGQHAWDKKIVQYPSQDTMRENQEKQTIYIEQ